MISACCNIFTCFFFRDREWKTWMFLVYATIFGVLVGCVVHWGGFLVPIFCAFVKLQLFRKGIWLRYLFLLRRNMRQRIIKKQSVSTTRIKIICVSREIISLTGSGCNRELLDKDRMTIGSMCWTASEFFKSWVWRDRDNEFNFLSWIVCGDAWISELKIMPYRVCGE